eukprot:scaffold115661_cov34-Tisochrysis_lutea.AAC.2
MQPIVEEDTRWERFISRAGYIPLIAAQPREIGLVLRDLGRSLGRDTPTQQAPPMPPFGLRPCSASQNGEGKGSGSSPATRHGQGDGENVIPNVLILLFGVEGLAELRWRCRGGGRRCRLAPEPAGGAAARHSG